MTAHPNRSRRADAPARNPTPAEIRALCAEHGLTQAQLAECLHCSLRAIECYVGGQRRMPAGLWQYAIARVTGRIERYQTASTALDMPA